MATSSGGETVLNFSLPLISDVDARKVESSLLNNLTTRIKQSLDTFRSYLQEANLTFVAVTNAFLDENRIHLQFEISTIDDVNKFYTCAKDPENALSKCINRYFNDHCFDDVGNVKISSEVACRIQMSHKDYQNIIARIDEHGTEQPYDRNPIQQSSDRGSSQFTGECKRKEVFSTEKTFWLYYDPSRKDYMVKRVRLRSHSCDHVNAEMKKIKDKCYAATVKIPVASSTHKCSTFIYTSKIKSERFYGADKYTETSIVHEVKDQRNSIRHWFHKTKECLLAYLTDLMFHASSNFDEYCEDIELPCKSIQTCNDGIYICKKLLENLEQAQFGRHPTLHFVIIMALVFQGQDTIVTQKLVVPDNAGKILTILGYFELSTLKTSCQQHMVLTCFQLSKLYHEADACLLSTLSVCYTYFGDKTVHGLIEDYLNTNKKLSLENDEMCTYARNLCRTIKSMSHDAIMCIELLIQNLPFKIACEVFHYFWEQISVSEEDQSDLKTVLCEGMCIQVEEQICLAKKSSEINNLRTAMVFVTKYNDFHEKFGEQISTALLTKIESEENFDGSVAGSIESLINLPDFFKGQSALLKLFKIISKSKSSVVRKCFVSLTHLKRVREMFNNMTVEDFDDLISALVATCRTNKPVELLEQFKAVCICLIDVHYIQKLTERDGYQRILEQKLIDEFKKLRLSSLLAEPTRTVIEQLAKDCPPMSVVYLKYLDNIITDTHASLYPQQLLKDMSLSTDKLCINDRLTADVLRILVKQYSKHGETQSDMFKVIIRHAEFWKILHNATGAFKKDFHEDTHLKAVYSSISSMTVSFKEHEVTYSFVMELYHDPRLSEAAKSLLALGTDRHSVQTFWNEVLSIFKREKDKLKMVKNVLEHIKLHVCDDLESYIIKAINHMEGLQKNISSTLTARQCEANRLFRGDMEQLPTLCKIVHAVMPSTVFWNICTKMVLEEFNKNNAETYAEDHSLCAPNVVNYLRILSKTGMHVYKDTWQLLSDDSNKCSMDFVLNWFGKKPNISNEIDMAETSLSIKIPEDVRNTLERVYNFEKLETSINAIVTVLKAFKMDIDDDKSLSLAVEAYSQLRKGNHHNLNFGDVRRTFDTVFGITEDLSENTVNIMVEVGESTSLLEFLKEIDKDDILNLIDAVDDISEQLVRESTVSALIEVQRYLQPFLKHCKDKTCTDLVHAFVEQTEAIPTDSTKLPAKIADCRAHFHNLKSLYNNIANRGEHTIEMVRNINAKGTFIFRINTNHDCVLFKAKYSQNEGHAEEERLQSTLIDLRNRAVLMNSNRNVSEDDQMLQRDLHVFVDHIDNCLNVSEALLQFYGSGHVTYLNMIDDGMTLPTSELCLKRDLLNTELSAWQISLNKVRSVHYLMNFIQGTQLCYLFEYLEGDNTFATTVGTMLKYIHPMMNISCMREIYNTDRINIDSLDDENMLFCIGRTLHKAFNNTYIYERLLSLNEKDMSKKLTDQVQTSRLLVAQLEENSILTVRTILGIYCNTTQRLPEPNQVLFCTQFTDLSEIQLLIERCSGAKTFYGSKVLFCIANVELLSNEIQFTLVNILRHLDEKTEFHLALVCRGSRNHPFLDELSEYVVSVTPATDFTVRNIFTKQCPYVMAITSDVAGLGKTNYIIKKTTEAKKSMKTLHVSGPSDKSFLVEQLLKFNLKSNQVLHVDIGTVEDVSELDTFIFELVVLRYVSAGDVSCWIETQDIKLEIANTLNNALKDSMQTTVLFQREHIKWLGIEALLISQEMDSPVQIVCMFLDCVERGTFNSVDFVRNNTLYSRPILRRKCKRLLRKYIGDDFCSSFSIYNIFLNVLADQLKKLMHSPFFRVSSLREMSGCIPHITVKSKLLHAMIESSKEFAKCSAAECRQTQMTTVNTGIQKSADTSLSDTIKCMNRWEGSNHLIFVFHNQNISSLSALYRKLDQVPSDIKFLFESQMKKKMDDFSQMEQCDLQNLLQKVARTNPLPLSNEKLKFLAKDYALTADNLLKMVLIILRTKSLVPVVLMGETGCGKTSLIRYLASVCEVHFIVMNVHAVTAHAIKSKVMEVNTKAASNPDDELWLFLDEINTSESIFFIGNVICHHKCDGIDLCPNLVVMGACNPYKLKSKHLVPPAGLATKIKTDELSRLVYRVLPLPEMLIDYVWDFGSLNEKDEEKYISRITADIFPSDKDYHKLLTSLLCLSQQFVRAEEASAYSVSLRDIQRCKVLVKWFIDILPNKPIKQSSLTCPMHIRAIILSLAHCYHSRFCDKSLRERYCSKIGTIFVENGFGFSETMDEAILNVIREEQEDILKRMNLPCGTASNTALQENVFVILACIYNRIPVFVVGKPGCSKSLAMQIIRSNLRGKDSRDDFFKMLPQLYCISFQGSESSTSSGITKVFEKAENYQKSNSKDDVLSVVLLDEIGLAEISRFKPLNVLHTLLEPDGQTLPNVAVVGISNWALDASKMNRVIHLSRTDMDVKDLIETAISISKSFTKRSLCDRVFKSDESDTEVTAKDKQPDLEDIAKAYFNYTKRMRFSNFHGLRDYYALVKYVSRIFALYNGILASDTKEQIIYSGLERNFGGLPAEKQTLIDCFKKKNSSFVPKKKSVFELITENIQDQSARHLMLITSGGSALGILEKKLREIGRVRKEVIFGSRFEEDLTEDYNYRVLSRVILCMEQGIILILKDLDDIYGSLYDMLNQNYTVIGKKNICRIALGSYCSPICHVHELFRCIVLTNVSKLDMSDPPFLNRFEKQHLNFFETITDVQRNVIYVIQTWIDEIVTTLGRPCIEKNDIFPLYSEDMVASLVLKHDIQTEEESVLEINLETLVQNCKKELLWLMRPEIIVRLRAFKTSAINQMVEGYLELPLHEGLEHLISYHTQTDTSKGHITVVFTTSNIYSKITPFKDIGMQLEKIGAFKSEKQLSLKLQQFWDRDDCDILVIQCNAKEDGKHIMLTKSIIEMQRDDYYQIAKSPVKSHKHVYMTVHLDRSMADPSILAYWNFLSEWKLVMLDSIESPNEPLPKLCKMSLMEVIQSKRPLCQYIKSKLIWAFTRISYCSRGRNIKSISNAIETIRNSPEFIDIIEQEIWAHIINNLTADDENWQIAVACNAPLMTTSSGFVDALETYISNVISVPLAKIIFKIEQIGVLESFFVLKKYENLVEKRPVWISLLHTNDLFSIMGIPDENGPEFYSCNTADISLAMPFSRLIFENVESTKEDFLALLQSCRLQCSLDENNDLSGGLFEEVLRQHEVSVSAKLLDFRKFIYQNWAHVYLEDFCNICTNSMCLNMAVEDRTRCMKYILMNNTEIMFNADPFTFVIHLHGTMWVNTTNIRAEMLLIDKSLNIVPDVESHMWWIMKSALQTKYCETSRAEYNSSTGICDVEVTRNDPSLYEKLAFEELFLLTDNEDSVTLPSESHIEEKEGNYEDNNGAMPDIQAAKMSMDRRTLLVHFICKQMLPTSKCLKYHSSIKQWQINVSAILSLSGQVSDMPDKLYSLKFCCDISNELIVPFNLHQELLERLGNMLEDGNKLDSRMIFAALKTVFEQASALVSGKTDEVEKACLRSFSSYLSMCFYSDSNTSAISFLFSMIKAHTFSENYLHLLKAPIDMYFQKMNIEACINLLTTDQLSDETETEFNEFVEMDSLILSLLENSRKHCLVALLMSQFEEKFSYLFKNNNNKEEEVLDDENEKTALNEQLVSLFYCSHHRISAKHFGIQYVASVAYFKSFVSQNVKMIVEANDTEFAPIMSIMNNACCGDDHKEVKLCLSTFFLKCLTFGKTHCRVIKICTKHKNDFNFLSEIPWTSEYTRSCFEISPLCTYMHNDEHTRFSLCGHLKEIEKFPTETIVGIAKERRDGMILIFSTALSSNFLRQFLFPVDDSCRTLVQKLVNEALALKMENNVLKYLKCISGEENFRFSEFDVTDDCSVEKFCQLSFCVSLYALSLAEYTFQKTDQISFLPQCLLNPVLMSNLCSRICQSCSYVGLPLSGKRLTECSCGYLQAFDNMEADTVCAVCGKKSSKYVNIESLTSPSTCEHSKISLEGTYKSVIYCRLHPVVYNFINLVTKSCFLGSVACNLVPPQEVAQAIGIEEENICPSIWKQIGCHWKSLRCLMNMDDYNLLLFLHSVLQSAVDVLFKMPFQMTDMGNVEAILQEEILNKLQIAHSQLGRILINHDDLHTGQVFEHTLLELDILISSSEANMPPMLQNLCKMNHAATKDNFICQLYLVREQFPLIALILESETKCSLPEHIVSIINWHIVFVAHASYAIKKNDCLQFDVSDFVNRQKDWVKSEYENRFQEFRNSWDYIKDNLCDKTLTREMKRLDKSSKLRDCLILDDQCIINKVLMRLKEIQNDFISKILVVAKDCGPLQFLVKDSSVAFIHSVHMTELKKEQLLTSNVDWVGLLNQESQCDLTYECGRQMNYNFHRIEQQLAVEMVKGKVFISTKTDMPKIAFVDELYKNYSSLIRDIRAIIEQESLPSDTCDGIKDKSDNDPKMATELSTSLGIVMTLLKKTGGDMNVPLVDYVDGWNSLLGRKFPKHFLPSPNTSIKLCHVVSLSDLLEEICAGSVKCGLDDMYRCKLDERLQTGLQYITKDEELSQTFMKALKRFIFRCLSTDTAEPKQPLIAYMNDESFWTIGSIVDGHLRIDEKQHPLTKVLPVDLMVQHVFDVYTTVETEIAKRHQKSTKQTLFVNSYVTKKKANVDKSTFKSTKPKKIGF